MMMKKSILSRALALFLVAAALFTLSAFAADVIEGANEPLPSATEITYEEILQLIREDNSVSLLYSEEGRCFIPQNVDGNQGQIAVVFTADGTTVDFSMVSYGGGSSYNTQLYRDNGVGSVPTKVTDYNDYDFGTGVSQSGLAPGTEYYFIISSNDVPSKGVNGGYVLDVH